MIIQEKHNEQQVMDLAQKLRLQRFCKIFLQNYRQDEDFARMDCIEQIYNVLLQVKAELEEVRYFRHVKKSQLSKTTLMLNEHPIAFDRNRISATEVRSMVDNIINKSGRFIILNGAAGSGKSSIGSKLLEEAMRAQCSCLYLDYSETLIQLSASYAADRPGYEQRLSEICSHDAIMLDDCFMDRCQEYEASALRDMINRCMEKRSTIIFASQVPVKSWYQHFNDPYGAESILDRVVKAGPFRVTLSCESLRQQSGVNIGADPETYQSAAAAYEDA